MGGFEKFKGHLIGTTALHGKVSLEVELPSVNAVFSKREMGMEHYVPNEIKEVLCAHPL